MVRLDHQSLAEAEAEGVEEDHRACCLRGETVARLRNHCLNEVLNLHRTDKSLIPLLAPRIAMT